MKIELELEKDDCAIEINGKEYHGVLEATVEVDYTYSPAENMSGRMEDAEPSSLDFDVEWAECALTIYNEDQTKKQIELKFSGVNWLEALYGEIEEDDFDCGELL